jgi:prepilin-type N-terminal cleavage/methylation domain-containing protein
MINEAKRGFTILELLCVLAIIAIVTAITYPVFANAKDRARVAEEMARVRNLYLAIGLYEGDHDQISPPSLVQLVSSYAPANLLSCPQDHRKGMVLHEWPANPWILWSPRDDSFMSRMRSPAMVSYFYMRSWERAFPAGRSYTELRNDPEVGFIAGFGLFKCVNGRCIFPPTGSAYNVGHPASNIGGVMVEARTDGSIVTRRRDGPCDSGMLFNQVFLFQDMNCRRF